MGSDFSFCTFQEGRFSHCLSQTFQGQRKTEPPLICSWSSGLYGAEVGPSRWGRARKTGGGGLGLGWAMRAEGWVVEGRPSVTVAMGHSLVP